jgi:hypothetical protein
MHRRWELAGLNPAVHRQMMGHSSETMTRLYSGEIPLQRFDNRIDVLEIMEAEAAAYLLLNLERPIGIEPTPEPWQGSI